MCRRFIESLLIEVYEAQRREATIQDGSGNYVQFSDMIRTAKGDRALGLSRNAPAGLDEAKRLGDLSAHNRRYTARQSDIDRARNDVRVVAEELLNIWRAAL